jgi:alkylation response protein AidB-like acyl-CoA dehydrogenase
VLISTFGSIKYKLAEQVIRTFGHESATYRVSYDIDQLINEMKATGMDKGRATIEAISHYAVEAALLKVYGSEILDYVADEAVQIHGGMGYSAEMAVERGYRDSRINRIFEGTNEINRLLVVDTAMKRAMKGDFDLFGEAESLTSNLANVAAKLSGNESYFEEKALYIKNFKKAALLAIDGASKQFGKKLVHEQEVLNNISDIMMQIYVAESMALRIAKLESLKDPEVINVYKDILDVYVYDSADLVRKSGIDAVNSFATPEQLPVLSAAIESLTKVAPVNIKESRRRIADKLIADNEYKF